MGRSPSDDIQNTLVASSPNSLTPISSIAAVLQLQDYSGSSIEETTTARRKIVITAGLNVEFHCPFGTVGCEINVSLSISLSSLYTLDLYWFNLLSLTIIRALLPNMIPTNNQSEGQLPLPFLALISLFLNSFVRKEMSSKLFFLSLRQSFSPRQHPSTNSTNLYCSIEALYSQEGEWS